MNAARALLGVYVPGRTVWHRLPIGWKYLLFLALVVATVAVPAPAAQAGLVALAAMLAASTRAPLRLAWGLPLGLVTLLAVLAAYQAVIGAWPAGVRVVATILTALYGSRLVLITTPMPVLVDALVTVTRPLRRLGFDPERFGLAVLVMLRSIPHVTASFGEVRQAARARGLERNLFAQVTPVVIAAVAYARGTGEALMARGLGDDAPEP